MAAVAATDISVSQAPLIHIEQIAANPDSASMRFKTGMVTLPATADNTDTVSIDLYAKFSITRLLAVVGFQQGTTGSVITGEAPTTAVSNNTLTITVGGSTANKARTFLVYGV